VRHGVRVTHVGSSRGAGANVASKTLDFGTFLLGATWRVFRLARRHTTIVAMTDPPLLAIAAWLVARLRGARVIHWVQDIYPELAIELAGQRWTRAMRPLRNRAWRQAARCVTLGADMKTRLLAAGVPDTRATTIQNWAPAGLGPGAADAIADTPEPDYEEAEIPMSKSAGWSRQWTIAAAIVLIAATTGATLFGRRYLAPATTVPTTGTLVIGTNPAGADVQVDGQSRGKTPLTLSLSTGAHAVELITETEHRKTTVTITPGGQVEQFLELPRTAPKLGDLNVKTEPASLHTKHL
jgi:hypothetical protein